MRKYSIKKNKTTKKVRCFIFTTKRIDEQQIESKAIVTNDGILISIISKQEYGYKQITLNEIKKKYNVIDGFFYEKTKELINYSSEAEKINYFIELERTIIEDIKKENDNIAVFVKLIENFSDTDYSLDLYLKNSLDLSKIYDEIEVVNINKSEQVSAYSVIIGKLEALQPILDIQGFPISIPLSNVPIGVLTSKELDFLTNNYERYTKLNLIPVFIQNQDDFRNFFDKSYFDKETTNFDYEFLSRFSFIENDVHYFYHDFVLTNEKGEFIIHTNKKNDIFLVFEVNLLKQGLTKDEIELNIYPYANFEKKSELIPSEVPHIFFKAIPINIVDIWNTNNIFDGIYEIKIKVNLDLRKWATYIFPPITYNGKKINDINFIKENGVNPIVVKVRDMTKYNPNEIEERYPTKSIQGCIIQNLYDYDDSHRIYYRDFIHSVFDEFKIFESNFFAIKLPANIFVPFDYHRNEEGEVIEREFRGLWLAAYQMKLFLFSEEKYYRTTSSFVVEKNNKLYDRDHYHLNLYDSSLNWDFTKQTAFEAKYEGIINSNKYPYEKAWSFLYPEKYKIPSKPKNRIDYEEIIKNNPNFVYSNAYPLYEDGEFIESFSELFGFGGIGMSFINEKPIFNSFAKLINTGKNTGIYKWEKLLYSTGEYSTISNNYLNGYDPKTIQYYTSEVYNGERFQRVECGYAYLLLPNSLPRVFYYLENKHFAFSLKEVNQTSLNVDNTLQENNIIFANQQNISNHPLKYNVNALKNHYTSYSLQNNSTEICIDLYRNKQKSYPHILADKLNIYRIIGTTSKLKNYLYSSINIPKTHLIISQTKFYKYRPGNNLNILDDIDIEGTAIIKITFFNKGEIKQKIYTPYNITIELGVDEGYTLKIENTTFNLDLLFEFILEANSEYNTLSNTFTKTKNLILFDIEYKTKNENHKALISNSPLLEKNGDQVNYILDLNADFFKQPNYNVYYLNTLWTNANVRSYKINGNNGLPDNCNNKENYKNTFVNLGGMMVNFGIKNGFDFPQTSSNNFLNEEIKLNDYGDGFKQLNEHGYILFYITKKTYKKCNTDYIRISDKNNLGTLTGQQNYEYINTIELLSKLIIEP